MTHDSIVRDIPITFPDDDATCGLIADQLAAAGFHELARQLRVAIKAESALEEPRQFGTIIAANSGSVRMYWQPADDIGEHYWRSSTNAVVVWPELTDVDVVRIGMGQANADECHLEEEAYAHGYKVGSETMNTSIHHRLKRLLDEAITSERKNALEKAIQAVEELAP